MKNDLQISSNDSLLYFTIIAGQIWIVDVANFIHLQWTIMAQMGIGIIALWLGIRRSRGFGFMTCLFALSLAASRHLQGVQFIASDVLDASREALYITLTGHNPYTHYYLTTRPPGSPFPYPPGEILYYFLGASVAGNLYNVEICAGLGLCFLLLALTPLIGTGRAAMALLLYGGFNMAVWNSNDGSNDVSATFLLVSAILCVAWAVSQVARPKWISSGMYLKILSSLGSFLLAWAVTFKGTTWPIALAVLLFASRIENFGKRFCIMFFATCAIIVVPFILLSPSGYFANMLAMGTFHPTIAGLNIWAGLRGMGIHITYSPLLHVCEILALLVSAFMLLRKPIATLGQATLAGSFMLWATMFFAPYNSGSYFTTLIMSVLVGICLLGSSTKSSIEVLSAPAE
jgi:hypothetical protein